MKNIEKYKDIVSKNLNYCKMETDLRKAGAKAVIDCAHTNCENCHEHSFKWLLEEYSEPILDDVERKYLLAIIKPFKNYVTGIIKIKDDYEKGKQYIRIIVKKYTYEYLNFPLFEENTMYKGMKENKKYTLEELGL